MSAKNENPKKMPHHRKKRKIERRMTQYDVFIAKNGSVFYIIIMKAKNAKKENV